MIVLCNSVAVHKSEVIRHLFICGQVNPHVNFPEYVVINYMLTTMHDHISRLLSEACPRSTLVSHLYGQLVRNIHTKCVVLVLPGGYYNSYEAFLDYIYVAIRISLVTEKSRCN